MSNIVRQVCERTNDTFVVKCVEGVSDSIKVAVGRLSEPSSIILQSIPNESFWTMAFSDWLLVFVGVFTAIGTVLAAWAAISASRTAKQANELTLQIAEDNRIHNYMSVRPELNFSITIDAKKNVCRIYLKNSGLGPAIITAFKKELDGVILNNNVELKERSYNLFDPDSVETSLLGLGEEEPILSSGETHLVLEITFEEPGDITEEVKLNALEGVAQSYVMSVSYTDMYRKTQLFRTLNKSIDTVIIKN
jgi:hypothetical protein